MTHAGALRAPQSPSSHSPEAAPSPQAGKQAHVLLMGAYGQDNLGDELILEVHLQQLRDFPVTVVSSNPEQTTQRYGVPAVRTYGGNRARTLLAFWRSHALVFGGGSLLKELKAPYFRYRLVVNLAAATLAAKACGKRVAFSAMGVERLPTRLARALARRAADGSDLFLARDEGSRRTLADVGARIDVHVTADPAYLLRADDAARARADALLSDLPKGPLVVLNPILSSEVDCPRERVVDSFAALCDHAREDLDANVVLFPFKTRGPDSDVDVAADVRARAREPNRVRTLPLDTRPSDALALLERADLFVGMRHHGILLTLVAGTPVVPVPYAEKTVNLVDEFGLGAHALPAHALSPEALVATFQRAHAARDAIRAGYARPLREMEARARDNFTRLRGLLAPEASP